MQGYAKVNTVKKEDKKSDKKVKEEPPSLIEIIYKNVISSPVIESLSEFTTAAKYNYYHGFQSIYSYRYLKLSTQSYSSILNAPNSSNS